MKVLDRYLARAVISGSLLAFMVLLALAGFFTFIDQLGDLKGDYTALKALEYVVYLLPRKGYELYHTAILLGTLLSLGSMSSNSELTVIRSAGVSIARISWSVMKAGFLLMILGVLLGEVLAPQAEQRAQKLKTAAITGVTSIHKGKGIWSKNKRDFIQVGQVFPDARLTDITIFQFDDNYYMSRTIKAERARYENEKWLLFDVTETIFSNNAFTQKKHQQLDWQGLLQPEMLDTLSVKVQNLSMLSLYRLRQSQQNVSTYELAFWMKVIKPFSVIIMLIIALPFVFGSMRTTSVGQRLLVGVLLGLGFHMFNQALNHIGIGFGLNAIVSAVLPSVLFAMAGLFALRRIF